MEHTYEKILSKPSDYRMCNSCGTVNWYDNILCVICGEQTLSKKTMSNDEMHHFLEEEKDFYVEEEGYDEDEIWNIKLEV